MKRLTKQWLREHDACEDGYAYYLGAKETDLIKFLEKCVEDNKLNYANWVIARKLNRKQKIQYAVFAAKQVLHIFEEKYPEDKRPREAIKAAEKCIKNNTKKNRAAADYAGAAARAAAAADAAAARAAAWAAADAAWAAADAAWAAADAAGADAARAGAAMKTKIIKYGIELLK